MISLLCPTRNRPGNVDRLVMSALGTAENPDAIEFVFYVDNDAPGSVPIEQVDRVNVVVGPRIVLSDMWNMCAKQASHDVMMMCGDDLVFRSSGWDRMVLDQFEEIPDRIGCVYGRDGIHDQNLATHGFYHRRWVEALGYFCPPYFASDYCDAWLDEVARGVGRRFFLPELVIEHMHPIANKALWDVTHEERLARHHSQNVDEVWRTTEDLRRQDMGKIYAAIRSSEVIA